MTNVPRRDSPKVPEPRSRTSNDRKAADAGGVAVLRRSELDGVGASGPIANSETAFDHPPYAAHA
jgi:hypothetical protein